MLGLAEFEVGFELFNNEFAHTHVPWDLISMDQHWQNSKLSYNGLRGIHHSGLWSLYCATYVYIQLLFSLISHDYSSPAHVWTMNLTTQDSTQRDQLKICAWVFNLFGLTGITQNYLTILSQFIYRSCISRLIKWQICSKKI